MKEKTNKKAILTLKIIIVIIVFPLYTFSSKTAKASGAWIDSNIGAAMWKQMVEEMSRQIQGALLAALKQAALETIRQNVNASISQGAEGGGPLWIVDWDEELFYEPIRQADLVMVDFFSDITAGRGSMSDYQSIGGNVGGDNYQTALTNEAKKATTDSAISRCEITNVDDLFTSGSWEKFNTIVGMDTCNQYGFTTITENYYASTIEKFQTSAAAKGQAYGGYKASTSGGLVVTPGSTIAAIQAQTEDLANKILAGVHNPVELAGSIVARMATKTIQQGIGQAQQYVQKEINKGNNYLQQAKTQSPNQTYSPKY